MEENNWVVAPLREALDSFVGAAVKGNETSALIVELLSKLRTGLGRVGKVKRDVGKVGYGIACLIAAEKYWAVASPQDNRELFMAIAEIGVLLASMEEVLEGATVMLENSVDRLEDLL